MFKKILHNFNTSQWFAACLEVGFMEDWGNQGEHTAALHLGEQCGD